MCIMKQHQRQVIAKVPHRKNPDAGRGQVLVKRWSPEDVERPDEVVEESRCRP